MIPDYKLYHGAVLAELVDEMRGAVKVRELVDEGRLQSYVLNERVGLHVKHSAVRLPPWQFTFTPANGESLLNLRQSFTDVFVVLVCWLDGMVCLSLDELLEIIANEQLPQGSVRAERSKKEWYSVSGSRAVLPYKKPQGVSQLIEALEAPRPRLWSGLTFWRRTSG
jgi:hypothetical protein